LTDKEFTKHNTVNGIKLLENNNTKTFSKKHSYTQAVDNRYNYGRRKRFNLT